VVLRGQTQTLTPIKKFHVFFFSKRETKKQHNMQSDGADELPLESISDAWESDLRAAIDDALESGLLCHCPRGAALLEFTTDGVAKEDNKRAVASAPCYAFNVKKGLLAVLEGLWVARDKPALAGCRSITIFDAERVLLHMKIAGRVDGPDVHLSAALFWRRVRKNVAFRRDALFAGFMAAVAATSVVLTQACHALYSCIKL